MHHQGISLVKTLSRYAICAWLDPFGLIKIRWIRKTTSTSCSFQVGASVNASLRRYSEEISVSIRRRFLEPPQSNRSACPKRFSATMDCPMLSVSFCPQVHPGLFGSGSSGLGKICNITINRRDSSGWGSPQIPPLPWDFVARPR